MFNQRENVTLQHQHLAWSKRKYRGNTTRNRMRLKKNASQKSLSLPLGNNFYSVVLKILVTWKIAQNTVVMTVVNPMIEQLKEHTCVVSIRLSRKLTTQWPSRNWVFLGRRKSEYSSISPLMKTSHVQNWNWTMIHHDNNNRFIHFSLSGAWSKTRVSGGPVSTRSTFQDASWSVWKTGPKAIFSFSRWSTKGRNVSGVVYRAHAHLLSTSLVL